MELATLARPYAEAIFELAVESDKLSQWSDVLEFLDLVIQDQEMLSLVKNPGIDTKTLSELLLSISKEQEELQISPEVENFIKLLAENHRLIVMPELIKQFSILKAEHEGYIKVELISTYAVKPPQKKQIADALEQRFGKKVEINVSIDRSLLGGWVIRAGDQVIDLSVLGRMQQLATELRG